MAQALLVLEDGRAWAGRSFGAPGEAVAEVVFNTAMTGYQEVLTDPSYKGQLVVMTVPHIGNYGVCGAEDDESAAPQATGFAVRAIAPEPSSFRATDGDIASYFKRHGLLGIEAIDTRALTRHLRMAGAMMGAISTTDLDPESLLRKVNAAPGMAGRDLVPEVTCKAAYEWPVPLVPLPPGEGRGEGIPIVVLDCGLKRNQLRHLAALGCRSTVVPATETAEAILARKPRGVVVSNGPGDPAAVSYAIATVRALLGRVPVLGICLGHQLLGLALGGRTYKLKFGHRGVNQPVKDLRTGRVLITSHNHGFAVDIDSIPAAAAAEPWFVNLCDGTNEGLRCRSVPAWSVQFHPEAAPGPNDAAYLFREFVDSLL